MSVSRVFSQEIKSIPLQVHPLPVTLAQWKNTADDYFSQIQPTEVGYLLWSDFPVKVYLDKASYLQDDSAETKRWKTWEMVGRLAISHWSQYLPLVVVEQPEKADILIKREYPPLGGQINPQTGLREGMRARSGQTSYEFYWSSSSTNQPQLLLPKMTIKIHPGLGENALLGAIEHELGHALGIWGHSKLPTDRLYASQSPSAQSISLRDVNTLKRIYQQPTRLGWPLSYSSSQDSTRINSLTGSCKEKPKSNNSCFQ